MPKAVVTVYWCGEVTKLPASDPPLHHQLVRPSDHPSHLRSSFILMPLIPPGSAGATPDFSDHRYSPPMRATLYIAYPPGSDVDLDYYLTKHLPPALEIWRSTLIEWTIQQSSSTGDDGGSLPYETLFTCTWESLAALEAARGAIPPETQQAAWDDVVNYSKKNPVVWVMEQKAGN
ncbi:hypothetical protein GQ53DRAFT_804168 [Thozetella sp. PMI_491]|nr:hypothetical protein GQ53DRAFT_804168 [Thozetella sp. PMI_491]